MRKFKVIKIIIVIVTLVALIAFITFNPSQQSDKLLSHRSNNNELPVLQENKKRERNLTSIGISLVGLSSYIQFRRSNLRARGKSYETSTIRRIIHPEWILRSFQQRRFDKREGSSSSQGLPLLSYPYLSLLPVPRRTLRSSS